MGILINCLTGETTEIDDVVLPLLTPNSVTPLQMRRALRQMGLKATVDSYLATLDEETIEAWEYATIILRNNELIANAAAGLGMSSEQVDQLFMLAETL